MSLINQIDTLPEGLPIPQDDGQCGHLTGLGVVSVALPATAGAMVDLAALPGRSVVFFYPRTGQPGQPALVADWNSIPGARGCTPQTCGYRDLAAEFKALGCRVFGLSTQTTAYQQEAVARLMLPFPLLSDAGLALTRGMSLPTFFAAGQELIKRMAWVVDDGRIAKVFYPVFPPDQNAAQVMAWVRAHPPASAAAAAASVP